MLSYLWKDSGGFILYKNIQDSNIYEKIFSLLEIYNSTSSEKEKKSIKTEITILMTPVVKKIARTIARRASDPIEDLEQAGFIGLLKAVDNFSKKRNENFRVYAGCLIIGEMRHYLRDKLQAIRVPRHIQELSFRINNFTKNLTLEEIQALTSEEVASALNTTTEAVDAVMQIERRGTVISLEDIFNNDTENLNYEDILPSNDYKIEAEYEDAKIILNDVIKKLPNDQQNLINMYYRDDMTKKEIADSLVISPMSVTRRMKQAFSVMSTMILDESERKMLSKQDIN